MPAPEFQPDVLVRRASRVPSETTGPERKPSLGRRTGHAGSGRKCGQRPSGRGGPRRVAADPALSIFPRSKLVPDGRRPRDQEQRRSGRKYIQVGGEESAGVRFSLASHCNAAHLILIKEAPRGDFATQNTVISSFPMKLLRPLTDLSRNSASFLLAGFDHAQAYGRTVHALLVGIF